MNATSLLPQLADFNEPSDPQLEASAELEEVARHLDLERWITQRLLHPERELTANLVVTRDSGASVIFTGYRVQHLTSRGPTMGGISFSQHAYLSGIRAAAMQATWQAALLNLPFGGAAGAIICNPEELSEDELRQLSKEYAHAMRGMVGRFQDVLAPGLGCHTQMIAWMLDSIAHDEGRLEPGALTGKPEAMYGLPDYTGMTTRGIVALLEALLAREALKKTAGAPSFAQRRVGLLTLEPTTMGAAPLSRSDRVRSNISGLRVSIQGFGSLGASIARALYDFGAHIIAIADISGGLCNSDGIDVPALQEHVQQNRLIFGFEGAESVCNADVLEADCDILITAAAERQISLTNAERIRARIVIEASKSAITSAAEQVLASRGRAIVPEILATSGAAIAAFLEWNQSARFSTLSALEVQSELTKRINAALDSVLATAEKNAISLRRAAHLIAIDRIASEMRMRK
jgi:glutamate dehydrogenase (NAD(P)+)